MNKATFKFNNYIIEALTQNIKEKFRSDGKPEEIANTLEKIWKQKLSSALIARNKKPEEKYHHIPIYFQIKPIQNKKLDGNSSDEGEENEHWEEVHMATKTQEEPYIKPAESALTIEKSNISEPMKDNDTTVTMEDPSIDDNPFDSNIKKETKIQVNEEALSSDSDDSLEEFMRPLDKAGGDSLMFAQYDEVHRSKKSFKCKFHNVIMKLDSGDYVATTAVAEIDY